jgi:REP element-mobilizing transposase RayT
MARPLRIEYDGAVYHITSRGNDKKKIYRDEEDRELFLSTLQKVNDKYNWYCHAYCLMDNHYHLVIETPDGNLSRGMRQLNAVYTQAYNKRHNRVGHVFQGRYKAILISKESHLLEVCRYVVLNPVRAGATRTPEQWKWSSYRGMAGLETPHPALTADWVLGQFAPRRAMAQKKYAEFVHNGIQGPEIWKGIRGQIILGDESFTDKMVAYATGREELKEIPRGQRYFDRPGLRTLFGKGIRSDIAKRNETIRAAVEKYGYGQNEVSEHLGLHYTTISRIVSGR